jgi:DNA-binding NtrC family response regulator
MKNVLIVEDESEIRESLVTTFSKIPEISIATCKSAHEAIEYLSENKVQLIISDIAMNSGSGIDLIKSLKTKKIESKLLIYSAYGDILSKAVKERAIGILSKPTSIKVLREKVKEYLEI